MGYLAVQRMGSLLNFTKLFFIGISIVLSTIRYSYSANLSILTIRDFKCGLIDTWDAATIGDGCSQQLWNVDLWSGRITKRRGTILQNSATLGSYSTQPTRFEHEFPDQNGNFWLISASSATIFKSNNAGVTNSVLTSTHGFTTTSNLAAINAFSRVRLTDGTTNWVVFDGSNVTVSTPSPKGNIVAFFFGRVWVAGVTGQKSALYASGLNDPENWTDTDTSDADPFIEYIRKDDGYDIKALVTYGDTLLIFKDYSIDALTMANDGLTPQITPISNTIGTSHRQSIQVRYNDVIFMGHDNFYSLTGTQLSPLSQLQQNMFNSILQKNSNFRNYTETSEADFTAGTRNRTSATLLSGSVVLSTYSFLDDTQVNFQVGSAGTGLSTTISSGSVVLQPNGYIDNFNRGYYTSNPTWNTIGSTTPSVTNGQVVFSSGRAVGIYTTIIQSTGVWKWYVDAEYCAGGGSPYVLITTYVPTVSNLSHTISTATIALDARICRSSQDDLYILNYGTTTAGSVSFVQNSSGKVFTLTVSSYNIAMSMSPDGLSGSGPLTVPYSSGTIYSYFTIGVSSGTGFLPTTTTYPVIYDNISTSTSTTAGVLTSTFTSQYFSLSSYTTYVGSATVSDNINAATITYTLYGDTNTVIDVTNSATYISSYTLAAGTTNAFTLGLSSYVFYGANFVRTNSDNDPTLNSIQLSIKPSSGTYLGGAAALTSISAFGNFAENHTDNSGTIVYTIYTDSDTALSTTSASSFTSSQTITNNVVPAMSTAAYARIGIAESITSVLYNPSVQDYTINWYQGAANFPVASMFFEGDYLCAVSTENTSYNDTVLVYDRNNSWSKYSNLKVYSMTRYINNAYYGDAVQGSIYRWQVPSLYNDNNSAIPAYWKSKEFDFGSPITDKTMLQYFITARASVGGTATFSYGVNRGAQTSVTLNLGSVSGFFRKVINPASLTYQRGISHSVIFQDATLNNNFDILSLSLNPRLETDPF